MKFFATLAMLAMGTGALWAAATPCPAVGSDTNGCEFIITVTAVNASGAATAFTVALNAPDQGPFDGVEDTLVGVVNNSGAVLKSLTLSNLAGQFGFEGDGACNGSYTPGPTAAQCLGGVFGSGSTGNNDYLSLTATSFSNITATSGQINFGGTTGIAAAATSWFDLEGALTAATLAGGAATPAPSSIVLLSIGLAALAMFLFAKRKFANVN
jgi:hypothetical protein